MAKVDRLGWTAGLSFNAYGTRFGIRVNDPAVLSQVEELLPLGSEIDSEPIVDLLYSLLVGGPGKRKGVRRYHLLYAGAGRLARTMALDQLFTMLESHLQLTTAYLADDYLFVHAGVVGWQGRAIVIPGRSFTGKTSLVTALVRAGATYYSDEYAIFDPEGRVHPYPRPLSIREQADRQPRLYPVEALGGQTGQSPLPVGLVVVTKYQAGARWRPRTLSPSRALLALMDNTVAARRNPEFSLPVLGQVVSQAAAIKSKRDEAADIVEPLLARLG
jgi:hypothetical protein